ncbi:MAG: hypothetical protein LBU68_00125 [Rickettsiales bacterium]|jgi:hypothetical protein|nr:hypothetical protein [Rickettsiales bacterium]
MKMQNKFFITKTMTFLSVIFFASCAIIPEEVSDFNTTGTDEYSYVNIDATVQQPQEFNQPITPISTTKTYTKEAVRTQELAEKFSLELPMRCNVDWESQKLLQAQPYDPSKIQLRRTDMGDELPVLRVDNLYFKNTPVNEVLAQLLRNTGIEIVSFDQYYNNITLDIGGKLSDVIEVVTRAGGVFYTYDNRSKTLTLKRSARWALSVPYNNEIILSTEDALRGTEIDNIVINWPEKEFLFSGDIVIEKKVRDIITKLKQEHSLIAFDMDVYRVYPKNNQEIRWMNLLDAFTEGTVKVSYKGIIGRALAVGGNLSSTSLKTFLNPLNNVVEVSQGTFVLPNRWQSRFDVGRCGRETRLETDLYIMAEPVIIKREGQIDKMDIKIVLRTSQGDIAQYQVPVSLGDNILIIGIPTMYFVKEKTTVIPNNTELVILLSPRLIALVPTEEQPKN